MNTKTMEGLVGAGTNMELVNTPMRIYKEARLKGDTATMERAMGYVNEFEGKAEQYRTEADEGMREDAKEARERVESEREKTIEERRKEREKLEQGIEESRATREDKVEISEDGRALLENSTETKTETADIDKVPVVYAKTGEIKVLSLHP